MLTPSEIAVKGVAGVHAEIKGIDAAKALGLTPVATGASRQICSNCDGLLNALGIAH